MMSEKIAAGIVLYNPEPERLGKCLRAVYKQVDRIFLVDNGSKNFSQIKDILEEFCDLEVIPNEKNIGIAAALNQLMKRAAEKGYRWLLTLDDDSVCDDGMVAALCKYEDEGKIGIICPVAVDDKMQMPQRTERSIKEIDSCITAGALTNVSVWFSLGGFDERMFIDFVDVEYCMRLRKNHYRILQVDEGKYIHQQYGNIRGAFSLFGKKLYLFDYPPKRIYFSVRNQIYYMKKHKDSVKIRKQLLFLTGYIGKRLIFEKNRKKSLAAVCRGIIDGIKMQI